jgi:hypothetical protein
MALSNRGDLFAQVIVMADQKILLFVVFLKVGSVALEPLHLQRPCTHSFKRAAATRNQSTRMRSPRPVEPISAPIPSVCVIVLPGPCGQRRKLRGGLSTSAAFRTSICAFRFYSHPASDVVQTGCRPYLGGAADTGVLSYQGIVPFAPP